MLFNQRLIALVVRLDKTTTYEAALRAKLADPNLASDHMIALMNEVKELQEILKNLQQRFIR